MFSEGFPSFQNQLFFSKSTIHPITFFLIIFKTEMNGLIIATFQSGFSLPPLFFAGTNVKSSAETSQATATFWAVQCSAPVPTAT